MRYNQSRWRSNNTDMSTSAQNVSIISNPVWESWLTLWFQSPLWPAHICAAGAVWLAAQLTDIIIIRRPIIFNQLKSQHTAKNHAWSLIQKSLWNMNKTLVTHCFLFQTIQAELGVSPWENGFTRVTRTHLCGCAAAAVVPTAVMAVAEHQGFWVCRPGAATRDSAASGYRPAW